MSVTETLQDARQEFVVSRTFNAPRAQVWRAWTDADALARWWGPKGCTLRVIALDVRPGGIFHYAMEFGGAPAMFGRFVYREVTAPEKLVFVTSFADAAGSVIRAPFSETWPLGVHNTLTLTETGDQTALTLRGGPVDPTDAEYEIFLGMFPSMQQGFAGTFEQLDSYLTQALA
ncbi:activator of HSP90 ATPase [Afipia sp. P52-10]|jgi:uncharacterized protein YndB with AHSA1/START domain|uniref:SRPBCC family protein n=1 Tax=Afipia sp. P52-10 TaxID=1429916 RepID=UPI0003DF36C0|nr:SRPBCC domain-containing protein [Afipia sp. P52-10]ETR77104.1 activator of HSP90 ATPase [Afipia sp. P52-10]